MEQSYRPLIDANPRYNTDPKQSARLCGCDPGVNHMCADHYKQAFLTERIDLLGDLALPPKGIGGAPTRPVTLPDDPKARKTYPIASGVMDYFPDALVAIAHVSYTGNEQHNPGKPLHWDRSKSADESDTMQRHFMQRGTFDKDGIRHSAKMAWRALALLQKEIESEQESK